MRDNEESIENSVLNEKHREENIRCWKSSTRLSGTLTVVLRSAMKSYMFLATDEQGLQWAHPDGTIPSG